MKDFLATSIDEALDRFERFDAILDVRSPAEYVHDHLPGAISTPVLSDAERAIVGTIDRQRSPFEARRMGAALVARNIAAIIEHQLADKPARWRPLLYCWRGGNRSRAFATVLSQIGWRCEVLKGGYREFRRRVVSDLERAPRALDLRVLAGRTGSGKSLLLQRLQARGAQTLDLEALANHRGSVLGLLPDTEQPSQKHFETRLWHALRGVRSERPVYVEAESRRIGLCHLPDALMASMRAAPCIRIEMSIDARTSLLISEYRHFTENPGELIGRLQRLLPLHGHRRIVAWTELVQAGHWQDFVGELLQAHYDPAYERSMSRNYAGFGSGRRLSVTASTDAALDALAGQVLELESDKPAAPSEPFEPPPRSSAIL